MSVIDDFVNKKEEGLEEYVFLIEGMLEDEDFSYSYAEETSSGILKEIQEEGRAQDRS